MTTDVTYALGALDRTHRALLETLTGLTDAQVADPLAAAGLDAWPRAGGPAGREPLAPIAAQRDGAPVPLPDLEPWPWP
jgi:hypothetical protein